MSRYAYIVCTETKQMIFLGKVVTNDDTGEKHFHMGDKSSGPNSENTLLMKSVMKFLAQNIEHSLHVVLEEDLDSIADESFIEIGNEAGLGVLMSDYIKGFHGYINTTAYVFMYIDFLF